MSKLAAFVGHSFAEYDREVVGKFLKFFTTIKDMGIGFDWDHAEKAESKDLSVKVKEKMKDKNCFIGICNSKENIIDPNKCKQNPKDKDFLEINNDDIQHKTSDWIIQEIGFALAKDMELIILLEEGVRRPGELQGNKEHITFNREMPEKAFTRILEMISSLIPKASAATGAAVEKPIEQEAKKEENLIKESKQIESSDDWGYGEFSMALIGSMFAKDKEENKNYLKNTWKHQKVKKITIRSNGK